MKTKSSKDIYVLVIGQYGKEFKCFTIADFSYKCPVFLEIAPYLIISPVIEQIFVGISYI